MDGECCHETVSQRVLTGTWVADEVTLAVQKCYEVIEVFEVYEHDVTQYDPQTGQGGLFAKYIDTFLKLKTEASGYPARFEPRRMRIATSLISTRVRKSY